MHELHRPARRRREEGDKLLGRSRELGRAWNGRKPLDLRPVDVLCESLLHVVAACGRARSERGRAPQRRLTRGKGPQGRVRRRAQRGLRGRKRFHQDRLRRHRARGRRGPCGRRRVGLPGHGPRVRREELVLRVVRRRAGLASGIDRVRLVCTRLLALRVIQPPCTFVLSDRSRRYGRREGGPRSERGISAEVVGARAPQLSVQPPMLEVQLKRTRSSAGLADHRSVHRDASVPRRAATPVSPLHSSLMSRLYPLLGSLPSAHGIENRREPRRAAQRPQSAREQT